MKNFRSADIQVAWKLGRLGLDLRHFVNLAPRLDACAVEARRGADSANIDTTTANGQPIFGVLLAPAAFEHEPLSNARTRGNAELGVSRHMLYRHVDPQGRLPPDGEQVLRHRQRQETPHA